jgi:uncharacterized protein YndB with AHSA1/START domain
MKRTKQNHAGQIEKRVWIKASPPIIFEALTNAPELAHWFCDRATSDPQEGGQLTAVWKTAESDQKGRAVYTRILRDSLIELLWVDEGSENMQAESRHSLSYTIKPRRGGSEVAMRDEDPSQTDDETVDAISQGWNSVLLELKDYCERRERSSKTHIEAKPSQA